MTQLEEAKERVRLAADAVRETRARVLRARASEPHELPYAALAAYHEAIELLEAAEQAFAAAFRAANGGFGP